MDQFPYAVNIKGGYVNWKPEWLVITSNKEPDMWYIKKSLDSQLWPAFTRRIDYEIEFLSGCKVITYSNIGDLPQTVKKTLLERFTLHERVIPQIELAQYQQ